MTYQLGTKTKDLEYLEEKDEKEKELLAGRATKLREKLEEDGVVDRYEKKQPERPPVDENLVGARMEQLWEFIEKDGKAINQWCQGTVVAVKSNNRVHIKWDKGCLREGDPEITQETFAKRKWNKHVLEAWRYAIED